MSQFNLSGSGVDATIKSGIFTITLNRPLNANSYTQRMLLDLEKCISLAASDEAVNVIVITGAGDKVFCAGADRDEINTRDWRSVLSLKSASVFTALRNCPKVSVAAINGVAVGGGFELAISCDIRVASQKAKFWLPEPEFGLLPAAAATYLLPQYIGIPRAKDLILGGVRWSAQQAFEAGLLSQVTKDDELMIGVMEWVERIQKRDADAILVGKQILELNHGKGSSLQADLIAQSLLALNKGGIK